MSAAFAFGPVTEGDFETLLALRIAAMRESLERIGRFHPDRARMRFRAAYRPEFLRKILVDGQLAGCVAFGPDPEGGEALWLDNFYIDPTFQNRRLGGAVMAVLAAEADTAGKPVRLDVVIESDAKRFYERFGFTETGRDGVDIRMERQPGVAAKSGGR